MFGTTPHIYTTYMCLVLLRIYIYIYISRVFGTTPHVYIYMYTSDVCSVRLRVYIYIHIQQMCVRFYSAYIHIHQTCVRYSLCESVVSRSFVRLLCLALVCISGLTMHMFNFPSPPTFSLYSLVHIISIRYSTPLPPSPPSSPARDNSRARASKGDTTATCG